jgi:L-serine dehydratase
MPKDNIPLFEIFGPVMIGPSSSHTAGVARIAYLARTILSSVPDRAVVRFYGSLASTWKGHGSADAAIAGLLGIPPEDEALSRGREKLRELRAQGQGFDTEIVPMPDLPPSWHSNTVVLELFGGQSLKADGRQVRLQDHLTIRAASIGGGSICINEINGYQVELSGELEALLVLHHDEIGVIAKISHILAANVINIAATTSHRKEKGEEALLVIETDSAIPSAVIEQIQALSPVFQVLRVPSVGAAAETIGIESAVRVPFLEEV